MWSQTQGRPRPAAKGIRLRQPSRDTIPVLNPELQDAHAIGQVAEGNEEAFARLFDRHSPPVLGMLIRILGGRGEAEEVLQEVFLQAWQQAERYDPARASPAGWLLMLARSRALDRIRSRDAQRRREREVEREKHSLSHRPVGTQRLEAAERERAVESALDRLPDEQRTCIELAFFEGLSHTQIAERLEAPLGTVKSRVLLGMKKLRQALRSPVAQE